MFANVDSTSAFGIGVSMVFAASPGARFERRHEIGDEHRLSSTEVHDLVAESPIDRGDHTAHDIFDEGPVTFEAATVIERDGVAREHALHDLEGHHVGSSSDRRP